MIDPEQAKIERLDERQRAIAERIVVLEDTLRNRREEWERMWREWAAWRNDIDKWRSEYTGKQEGRQTGYAIVLSLIGALVGVIAIVISFMR